LVAPISNNLHITGIIVVAQATTMNNILTQFGFTENEHKVYVGIYKNPLSTGSDIARKLRMDKSSTYKAVES
jgi:DNA-binding MarR family transcriptional regulator